MPSQGEPTGSFSELLDHPREFIIGQRVSQTSPRTRTGRWTPTNAATAGAGDDRPQPPRLPRSGPPPRKLNHAPTATPEFATTHRSTDGLDGTVSRPSAGVVESANSIVVAVGAVLAGATSVDVSALGVATSLTVSIGSSAARPVTSLRQRILGRWETAGSAAAEGMRPKRAAAEPSEAAGRPTISRDRPAARSDRARTALRRR